MNTLSITNNIQTRDQRYFVVELAVDGSPLADFTSYATALEALHRSATEPGEHYILTCWCGIPECAGIYSGFTVQHDGIGIHWHIMEPEPERHFTFEASAYRAVIDRCISDARDLLHHDPPPDKGTLSVVPDDNAYFLGIYPWPDKTHAA